MIFSYLLHNTSFEFLFRFPGYSFWRSCDLGRLLERNTSLGPLGFITGLSGLGRLFSSCTALALLFPRLRLKWLPQPATISRTCSYFDQVSLIHNLISSPPDFLECNNMTERCPLNTKAIPIFHPTATSYLSRQQDPKTISTIPSKRMLRAFDF